MRQKIKTMLCKIEANHPVVWVVDLKTPILKKTTKNLNKVGEASRHQEELNDDWGTGSRLKMHGEI